MKENKSNQQQLNYFKIQIKIFYLIFEICCFCITKDCVCRFRDFLNIVTYDLDLSGITLNEIGLYKYLIIKNYERVPHALRPMLNDM